LLLHPKLAHSLHFELHHYRSTGCEKESAFGNWHNLYNDKCKDPGNDEPFTAFQYVYEMKRLGDKPEIDGRCEVAAWSGAQCTGE